MNIGIVGVGYWGSKLFRCFSSIRGCSVAMLCDKCLPSLTWECTQRQLDNCTLTRSYSEMLDNQELSAIVVATPPREHYRMVRQALQKKKHVFVEKPIALSYDDALILQELAKQQNMMVHVDHLLLYHSAIIELKRLLLQGVVGDIFYTTSQRLGYAPKQDEGPATHSLLPHDISLLLYLGLLEGRNNIAAQGVQCVKNMQFVYARIENVQQSRRPCVHYINSALYYPDKVRLFCVAGTRGFLVFDDTKGFDHKIRVIDCDGKTTYYPAIPDEPLMNSCESFVDSARSGRPSLTDALHGAMVTKIIEHIHTLAEGT